MRNKRRLGLIGIVALIAVLFVGCASNGASTGTDNVQQTETAAEPEPVYAEMPDLADHTYKEARKLLSENGFEDYTCYDDKGEPVLSDDEYYIVTEQSIKPGEKIDVKTRIEIKASVITYDLYFSIDFHENLFLDKYDVELCVDGETMDHLIHGEAYSKLINTSAGSHVINLYKDDDRSIEYEKEIVLETDSTFSCELQTHKDNIEVTNALYQEGIEGSAIEMPDVKGMSLPDANDLLDKTGFKKVKAAPEDKDDVIVMDDNWTVVKQSIEPGTKADQYAEIELLCKKTEELTQEEAEYVYRDEELKENEVRILKDSYALQKDDYKTVIQTLKQWGFENITEQPMYDIVFGITPEGSVEKVIIDGKDDYSMGDVYKKNVEVIVIYHLSEESDPSRVSPPYSSEDAGGKDIDTVIKDFEDAGFTNVISKEKEADEAMNVTDGSVKEVLIGSDECSADETYKPDDEVTIVYYKIKASEASEESEDAEEKSVVNSGKVAYVNRGPNYWIYYLIDFDNKTVKYGTTDGSYLEGTFTGDNLNDGITVTYPAMEGAQERLHYRYKDRDSTLTVVDSDGVDWFYDKTDVKSAEKYLNKE